MSGGGGGKGSTSYVVGYWYLADILFMICHSMTKLKAIMVGDKVAWSGDAAAGRININKPSLFGGESSEGGIVADIDLMDGNKDQVINSYLVSRSGTDQPAYRGLVTALVRNGKIAGINPYLKSWSFLIEDTTAAWHPELSLPKINGEETGMNPALIIWDVLTSQGMGDARTPLGKYIVGWGMHFNLEFINDAAFLAAAQTLYDEGIGLAPTWDGGTTAEDFIDDLCDYIDGTVFVHPRTGKWVLKLFRGDYDVDDLVHIDESSISKVNSFTRKLPGDLVTKAIITWTQVNTIDGECETPRTIPVPNTAAQALIGRPITLDVDGKHATNGSVARKIAERRLTQQSYPIAMAEIVGNRSLSQFVPGDVFLWSSAADGIARMPMRILKVNYGSLAEDSVTLTCSEDVYGLGFTMFSGATETGWVNPIALPQDAENRRLEEMPYHIVVNRIESEDALASRDETSGLMMSLIGRPSGTSLAYELYQYVSTRSAWVDAGNQTFTPEGILSAAITQTSTTIQVEGITEPQRIAPDIDYLAVIESEWVWVKSGTVDDDLGTATLTIGRGVLDTVPATHVEGARVWFVGVSDYGFCRSVYLQSLTIRLKACTMTTRGILSLDEASENTKIFDARAIRPYPPANVRINGVSFPTTLADDSDITVTWDNRNRIEQTGAIDDQAAGNFPVETGTTNNLYIYDAGTGALIRSVTDLATEPRSWTYALSTEFADREEHVGEAMRLEVESVRDDWASWQRFVMPVPARTVSVGCLVTSGGDILITNTGAKIAYQE